MGDKDKDTLQLDDMKNIQEDVQTLRSKFKGAPKRGSREGSEDRGSVNKLRDLLKDRENEIEELNESIIETESKMRRQERKLQKEIVELKNETEELSEELKGERKICGKYRNQVKKLEKSIEELEMQLYTKDAEIKVKDRKLVEEMRMREESKYEDELQKMKTVLEKEITALKNTIENLNLEHKDTIDKIMSEKQNVVERLKTKIDECNVQISSLQETISTLKVNSEDTLVKEREKNEQLNSMLKNQQFTIADLEDKIKKLIKEGEGSRISVPIESTTITPNFIQARPEGESAVSTTRKAELATSEDLGDAAACPNCGRVVSVSSLEDHLDKCLEDF